MPDLLVKLYDLPPAEQPRNDVSVRRAFAAEKRVVTTAVARDFGDRWAGECEVAFTRQPIACFVALQFSQLVGFACYDATARGFFGPLGVRESQRRQGVGRALLLASLHDMVAQGYGYAIIGAAGSAEFYRSIGTIEIPDSTPGFYRGLLRSGS